MKEFVVLRKNIGNNNEPRVVSQFCHHLFFNYHGMIFSFCGPLLFRMVLCNPNFGWSVLHEPIFWRDTIMWGSDS